MGSAVLLISGIMTLVIKQIHFIIVVLLCMIAGYLYSVIFEVPELAWFAILFNGVLSLLAVSLIKLGLYTKQKADRMIN